MRPKSSRNPDYLALQRRQIDARRQLVPVQGSRPDSWVRTIRSALGMSAAQLARRLGVSQQAVTSIERNERRGAVTIATLARVADAVDCDVVIEFRPKTSLEETVRRQAVAKARAERERVIHTMRLEDQHDGVEQVLDLDTATKEWMTARMAKLWA